MEHLPKIDNLYTLYAVVFVQFTFVILEITRIMKLQRGKVRQNNCILDGFSRTSFGFDFKTENKIRYVIFKLNDTSDIAAVSLTFKTALITPITTSILYANSTEGVIIFYVVYEGKQINPSFPEIILISN